MKRILFLFMASLLLLACSNDDSISEEQEEQQTEFKIKKFTTHTYPENSDPEDITVRVFSETGEPIYDSLYSPPSQSDYKQLAEFSYNTNGFTSEINFSSTTIGPNYRIDDYSYYSDNRITNIFYKDNAGDTVSKKEYTYENGSIRMYQANTVQNYYFNNEGLISKVKSSLEFSSSIFVPEYLNENINTITDSIKMGSLLIIETRTIQYDEKINPLFGYIKDNYLNSFFGTYSSFFRQENYFSKNNFTQINFTSTSPNSDYIIIKTTQYNEAGYPTSAIVKKNDVVIQELTYEYY